MKRKAFNRQLTVDIRLVSPTETRTFLCLPMHTPTTGNRYHMTHTVPRAISCRSDKNDKNVYDLTRNAQGPTRGTRTAKSMRADDKNVFFFVVL